MSPTRAERNGFHPYTDAELLDLLRRYGELLGETPSAHRMEVDCKHLSWLPRPTTYRNHFGGWNAALSAAGLVERAC